MTAAAFDATALTALPRRTVTLRARGCIDAHTAPSLGRLVAAAEPSEASRLRLDLRAVTVLSAAGVSEIVRAVTDLPDPVRFEVLASPEVAQVLSICGLDALITGGTAAELRRGLGAPLRPVG